MKIKDSAGRVCENNIKNKHNQKQREQKQKRNEDEFGNKGGCDLVKDTSGLSEFIGPLLVVLVIDSEATRSRKACVAFAYMVGFGFIGVMSSALGCRDAFASAAQIFGGLVGLLQISIDGGDMDPAGAAIVMGLAGCTAPVELFERAGIAVGEGGLAGVEIGVSLDPFLGGVFEGIASYCVVIAGMCGCIATLINSDGIDVHGNVSFHHLTESGVESALALGFAAIVAWLAPGFEFVGKSPAGGDGGVEDDVRWFCRDLRSHEFGKGLIFDGDDLDPVLTLSVVFGTVFHGIWVGSISLGKPIQSPPWTGLPLKSKGMHGFEMVFGDLMHTTHGVSLKSLFLGSLDGLIGFSDSEISAVEEGVEGGIAVEFQAVVPFLSDAFNVTGWGHLFVQLWLVSFDWSVVGHPRCYLQRHVNVR